MFKLGRMPFCLRIKWPGVKHLKFLNKYHSFCSFASFDILSYRDFANFYGLIQGMFTTAHTLLKQSNET